MVSQHIIDIIIKAEDQASQAAKKVEDAMNRVSNTSKRSMDSASNSMNKFDSSVQKAAPTLDNFTQRLQAAGTGGGRAFQQLSQAEIQMVTNLNSAQAKMGEFGNQITSTASKTSMLGSTGTSAFNQLTFAEQRALVQLSSMSATTNSTATQMNSAWDRVKTKVSSVSTSIKTGLSNALSSARSKIDSIASAFDGLGGIISSADFVNTMDSMTNESLVSLNDLGQAMNTIKMSTGMSNSELKNFSTTVNDIGQRAILMGKDTNEAMTMMQAAGSGLNGEFDVLKSNFGITKEKLMDLGWSGASEDVAGYQEAIEKYLEKAGSMDDMMNTTTGKLKQVEKGFTSAGRQIGEQFMPYIDQALDFMIDLKEDCPQAYTAIVALSGAFSGFVRPGGLVRRPASGGVCLGAGAVSAVGGQPGASGACPVYGDGDSPGGGGRHSGGAAGDCRGLRLRRPGRNRSMRAGHSDRRRTGVPAGAPVRSSSGRGFLRPGEVPLPPLFSGPAAADLLGLSGLLPARHAQGCTLLLRGSDGHAAADLDPCQRRGPHPLHHHLHRGRQRPGDG